MRAQNDSQAIAAYLIKHHIDGELVAPGCDMPTVSLAAAALGVRPEVVVKSIVFEGRQVECVALAIVSGNMRVDPTKVAASLRLPPLRLARPEVVRQQTGYEIGGVPPIAHAEPLLVVVDRQVLEHNIVFGGGGYERHMLRISPHDIVRITGALVAEIVSPPKDAVESRGTS